ncbi:hypothetical protein GCM10022255_082160 [Dactylosporangium darangshiense]|uniref:Uncharacterized protein n=1 Tax=Dactylosporangium darangshiense TaxID=579108 RepID=A0ABP8DLL4_9ACTN
MRRVEVETLLDDAGTAGEACKAALRLNAEVTVWDKQAPAFGMRSTYRFRHALMQEDWVSTVGYEAGSSSWRTTAIYPYGSGECGSTRRDAGSCYSSRRTRRGLSPA